MATTPSSSTPLELLPGAVLALRDARGWVLHVHSGRIWLTRSGCLDDVFVGAGGSAVLTGHRVVIENDTSTIARLMLVSARPAAAVTRARPLHAAVRLAARWLPRTGKLCAPG